MKKITSAAKIELRHCIDDLEDALAKLDAIGAGIAAIHVDAAIEQLRGNLASVEAQASNDCDHNSNQAYARMRVVH